MPCTLNDYCTPEAGYVVVTAYDIRILREESDSYRFVGCEPTVWNGIMVHQVLQILGWHGGLSYFDINKQRRHFEADY